MKGVKGTIMDNNAIYLSPALKECIWGGTKLKTKYNKKSDIERLGESWELSTHKDGASTVKGGIYDGLTLNEYIEKNEGCLGANAEKFEYFPILIKFIDALDNLSIQVHPDDAYAMKVEGEYGKTEMWYILEADEGAYIYYGVNRKITKDEFKARIKDNTVLEVLNKVPVKKGDVFFIKSGTIHAIGKGIVICEIQQNSNTTYRVYDYDRRDKNGNPRELHIDKAIDVSTLEPAPKAEIKDINSADCTLAECGYFTVRKLNPSNGINIKITDKCFHSLIVTDGNGLLTINGQELVLTKGDSVFIPAQNGEYSINGKCDVILSYV